MTQDHRYVAGLGEILWDILPEGKKLGGAPANFAYHAGQFLGQANTLAISALGEDDLGRETLASLNAKGLGHLLPTVPHPTGTVQVTLDQQGIPAYDIKEQVAWDNIPFNSDLQTVARHCRAVCFGSLAQRSSVSRKTIQQFLDLTPQDCLKIFDINLRQQFYTKEVLQASLHRCNILKINDEELEIVGQMFGITDLDPEEKCHRLIEEYHLKILVLTCGVAGSYVFTPNHRSFLDTPQVQVADTVGAGDSFTGSFCAALLMGKSIAEAHKLAVEVSAFVCTQNGAMPTLPDRLLGKKQ